MGAALHDAPVLQHDDGVGVAHGGQPVGDHEHRAPFHQAVHALFDQGFGAGVDAGRGFVQDQHRRVRHRRAGDGQKLPLALAQVRAVGRNHRFIPLGQAAYEGVRIGDAGRLLNFLLGGVQLAEADIIRHGAGEQVGILQHDAQGTAQRVLADEPDVDAVIGDGPRRHIVEAVDEVGDGGLARAGGTHEGNFLPRFGVERKPLQDQAAPLIAKVHVMEPHIAAQRHKGHVGAAAVAPGPAAACAVRRGDQRPAGGFLHGHEVDGALVGLGRFLHGGEDTLGARQRRQQEVALLGELVDGHGGLAHKDQIAGQAAQVGPALHDHKAAQHRDDRIVDIPDADHRRDHGGGVALGAGTGLAQFFVAGGKALQVGLLVVEHLDDLLPGDHFLDIGVEFTQAALLPGVVGAAAAGTEIDIPEHGGIPHQHHQRKLPVQHEQQDQRAHDLHEGLDHEGEAVVQRVGHGIHVVGEQAHQIALAVGIEELQRQFLQVGEEVAADLPQNFLGRADHDLGIAQRAEGAHQIDDRRDAHAPRQMGEGAVFQQAVDDRADHVGAQQGRQGADRSQHGHQRQQDAVAAQVAAQAAEGIAEVFGAAAAGDFHHCAAPPFIWE